MNVAPKFWMQTIDSGYVDLMNPKPEQINWNAASIALARIPRWNGHTEHRSLPVAQHLEQGARAVLRETGRRDIAAAFLLHDAHEYVMGDISTPVALALGEHASLRGGHIARLTVKDAIASLKETLDIAIYAAAGIAWPLPDDVAKIVKEFDDRMLVTEHKERMPPAPFEKWYHDRSKLAPLPEVDLYPWSLEMCAALYLAALYEFLPVFAKA